MNNQSNFNNNENTAEEQNSTNTYNNSRTNNSNHTNNNNDDDDRDNDPNRGNNNRNYNSNDVNVNRNNRQNSIFTKPCGSNRGCLLCNEIGNSQNLVSTNSKIQIETINEDGKAFFIIVILETLFISSNVIIV